MKSQKDQIHINTMQFQKPHTHTYAHQPKAHLILFSSSSPAYVKMVLLLKDSLMPSAGDPESGEVTEERSIQRPDHLTH